LLRAFPLGDPRHFAVVVLTAVLLVLAATTLVVRSGRGILLLRAAHRRLGRLARRRSLAVLAVGAGVLPTRALLLPLLGIPEPVIADEFSHLLLADTFASGRITNPTHPRWIHFESMFILHQPSYTSVYPVAQGLFLAVGRILAGHPWAGVWLSVGLMCAAICWMLQGWLPPGWALLGSALAALQFGVTNYWINSYWGGAPAAIGGALALGALPRLQSAWRSRHAVVLALGIAILANSRPYEGLVLSLGIAVLLFLRVARLRGTPLRRWFTRVALPAGLLLAATGAAMGYYFWRVTGSPFRMPYQAGMENHAIAPAFVWQPLRPEPRFRHDAIRDFHRTLVPTYLDYRSWQGAWRWTWRKAATVAAVYFGPLMLLPLLTLPCLFRDRRARPLLLLGAVVLVASFLTVHFQPHYVAPIASLLFALLAQGLRRLWVWQRWGNPIGRFVLPAVLLISLLTQLLSLGLGPARFPPRFRGPLLLRLAQQGGRHLVFVRYHAHHSFAGRDWVYNAAEIDAAQIVWARDMGPAANAELIRYYPDRSAWLLEPDFDPPRLVPHHPVTQAEYEDSSAPVSRPFSGRFFWFVGRGCAILDPTKLGPLHG